MDPLRKVGDERACILCDIHHDIQHHGREGLQEVREQCIKYLSLYSEEWVEIKDRYQVDEVI